MQTLRDSIYRHPVYYDLVFGADWKDEVRFLRGAFARFVRGPVRRVFEPACGSGRLLVRLARAGYAVSGIDLSPEQVGFCNDRLTRAGFSATAKTADMSDFRLRRPVDGAFNLINSFRHLPTDVAALGHLRSMAAAVRAGGVYLLGLHLLPVRGEDVEGETWRARRGALEVRSRLEVLRIDRRARQEQVRLTFDVRKPSGRERIVDEFSFRTYTARQMTALLAQAPEWECVETFDFSLSLAAPIVIGPQTQDVIYVLRRRES